MRKMFAYRLYPTKNQLQKLNEILEECRWLYNHLLERRKTSYEQEGKNLSLYDQQETFPRLKTQRPSLATVHSQVLQNVAARVDLAFQAFFRRCKAGETPGYPRFKGQGRYDSFTYPQSGFSLTHDSRVTLSKIGSVKMVYHRPLKGKIKTWQRCNASTPSSLRARLNAASTAKWWPACMNASPGNARTSPTSTAAKSSTRMGSSVWKTCRSTV